MDTTKNNQKEIAYPYLRLAIRPTPHGCNIQISLPPVSLDDVDVYLKE